MTDKPDEFIKKTIVSSFYMAFGLIAFLFLVLAKLEVLTRIMFLAVPIIYILVFLYLMRLPDMKISQHAKEVNKEIVFACRFLIIELESGVPLYNSLVNVSKNFENVGKYFKEITDKIDLGTTMEDAINEAVEFFPSNSLRKILWQIVNSLRTGANISQSLYTIVEQITKDQMNEVNKYGKKLNPMAMFYMIVAVIMPSLGMTMLIIISSFINLELSLTILLFFVGMLGFVQFMFIAMIKFSRPAIEF